MTSSIALSLLVIRCDDVERSRAFYAALGLELVREQHPGGPAHYSAAIGETVVELYPKGSRSTSGLRFGVRVNADPNVLEALVAAGGEIVTPWETGVAVVRDLDQHTIEITLCSGMDRREGST